MRFLNAVLLAFSFSGIAHAQVVCIDPGHPSENGGTTGAKITETRANWQVALRLEKHLKAKGITVVMTKKSENEKVMNRRRAEIANESHADLMVRLHCDSNDGRGFAVYYPTQTGTVAGVTGPSKEVLDSTQPKAKKFYAALVTALKGYMKENGLMSDLKTAVGGKQGALTGSIFSKVPVVLVEMVNLKNADDEALIISEEGQERLATALTEATLAALKKN